MANHLPLNMIFFYLLVCIAVISATVPVEGSDILRQKRGTCRLHCNMTCRSLGEKGGCCGSSGPCRNMCYCYGSGHEHRCHRCDRR